MSHDATIIAIIPHQLSSADRALAARVEAAEAANVVAQTHAASGSIPDAAYDELAGGAAIFAGAGSPITHALGIGMRGAVSEEEMERLEAFFRDRGSACLIDLCPLADPSVIAFVESRPYRLIELNNVLARRIGPEETFMDAAGVRPILESEIPQWARLISAGFAESMPVTDEMVAMMMTACKSAQCWFAGEPEPEAGAVLGVRDGVAWFSGDATLAGARRKGWQCALIAARLAAAQKQGCDLAVVTVLPGSISHRNYERAGFQLIYMRVNLMREFDRK